MRTTLTLDPDIERMLEKIRKRKKLSLKEAVNSALREGLVRLEESDRPTGIAFQTNAVNLGNCRLNQLDSISDALALGEGDDFR